MSHEESMDTMMDLGTDLDLLNDLLGLDSALDWLAGDADKLEPSLDLQLVYPSSPYSPLGPEPPNGNLQPMSPEQVPTPPTMVTINPQIINSQPSLPQEALSPPVTALSQSPVISLTNLTPLKVKSQNQKVVPTTSTVSHTTPNVTHPVQFTTAPLGFIPFTSTGMFGNTVLLPQLQLAVVESSNSTSSKKSAKLPMRRLEKEPGSHGSGRKRETAIRRTSHNAIERRYRSSINDKIIELKNMVCTPSDPNEKVHKAVILRSSIDTIRYLQNTNSRLDKENREMKKSMAVCPTCRNDVTLREILTSTSPATPPSTEPESATDSSNPPSPNEDTKPNSLLAKSPLVLFSIVTGLFLINPITNHSHIPNGGDKAHPHSRVERSIDEPSEFKPIASSPDSYAIWYPRILTIFINLFIFIAVYYVTTKVTNAFRKGRYGPEDVKKLREKTWTKSNNKGDEISRILSEVEAIPKNWFSRIWWTWINLAIMPFQLRRKRINPKYAEIYEEVSCLYLEYGKHGGRGMYPYLRAINYSPTNKTLIIRSLILSRSKFLLKYVLLWTDFGSHTFGTPEGIAFVKRSITAGIPVSQNNESHLQGMTPSVTMDETTQMMVKFREEMLTIGISNLLQFGGGNELFRIILKSCGRSDKLAQFWTVVMWAEAEWIQGGGRSETLRRLCRLIDELWKHLRDKEETTTLVKALYNVHMSKRAVMLGQVPSKEILDAASVYLRDSITTSTEQPRKVVQLIWCLAGEWILECRLELWEGTKEVSGFSKDLDTLRSLTHFIPTILPSVYLYEACQRLMNYAAPGRTQQLLDASLRQIRSNPRVLKCNNNEDEISQSGVKSGDIPNCKFGKKNISVNLVREKRKAYALYLKCKYLPNQVITCPGEKVGMLKEAMKALEKIGEKKKIKECLEMIRSLGQGITLH